MDHDLDLATHTPESLRVRLGYRTRSSLLDKQRGMPKKKRLSEGTLAAIEAGKQVSAVSLRKAADLLGVSFVTYATAYEARCVQVGSGKRRAS